MARDALVRIRVQDDGAEAGINRVSKALQRLERQEPAMALRQMRGALEELTASATGLDPRLARLGSTLSMFGIGGPMGIAAVGGFAAIAFEVKKLVNAADELDKKLLALNTTIATGPAATLLKAQGFQRQAEELATPTGSFLGGLLGGRGMFGERGVSGDTTAAEDIGRASERATALTGALLAGREFDRGHARAIEANIQKLHQQALAIETANLALDKAKLSTNASALALFDLNAKGELLKISLSNLDDPTRRRIELLTRERLAIERANLEREEALRTVGQGPRAEAPSGALDFFTLQARTNMRLHLGTDVNRNIFGQPIEVPSEGTDLARVGVMGAGGGRVGATGDRSSPSSPDTHRNIELAVGAALSVVNGLAGGGGTASAVGGLGSAATALSGLKGISKGAADILGPLGIGLSALSGLFSGLFGGHKEVAVMIDGYSSKALTQFQQAMVALTGFKGVDINVLSTGGNDVDRVVYALGRQARTDGMTRIPPGARRNG